MATNYYVDNEAPFDGDGGIATPWDNISGHIGSLVAGDTMHVRGDPLSARAYVESPITMNVNGTSGNPITLKAFAGEYVTIKTTPDAWNSTVTLSADWLIIDGFIFDNDFQSGWQITVDSSDHSQIINCTLTQTGGTAAIRFLTAGSSTDFLIDNCDIYDTYYTNSTDSHGIVISGTGTREVTITNCDIYDCRGDSIHLLNGTAVVVIEDCNLYTTLGKCTENAVDIKMGTTVTIRRCTMRGFRYCDASCGGSGGGIGAAIIAHQDIVSLTVEDCEFYDCTSGINLKSNTGICHISRNLIYDLVVDGATWLNTGIYCANNGALVEIFNNTFHELPEHLFYFSANADVKLRNNLAHETHDIHEDGSASVDHDYNGWYNCANTLVGANDTTGVGDPGFVDAANDDYRLAVGSPVIDQGVDVGFPYYGAAPDLGYDEWEGEGTSTTTTMTSTSSTSTSTTSTSMTSTSTSVTSTSTSVTSTSTSTTSSSTSSTSSSTTSTSTTSTSLSTTSTSTTSTSTTSTLRLRFWLHGGIIVTRYGVR